MSARAWGVAGIFNAVPDGGLPVLDELVGFDTVGREADGKPVILAGGLSHEHRGC